MESLVSIIVTVFNIEDFIERCLESLTKQTYNWIEIIIINDGSTDGSLEICERFSKVDKRINLITIENGGVSRARNLAIEICKGEYLTIVDGDDSISNDYIEILLNDLIDNNVDIAACSWQDVLETKKPVLNVDKNYCTVLSKEEALSNFLYQENIDASPWGFLYKTSLFTGIRFPEGEIFEDLAILYKIFDRTKKVSFRDYKAYFYTIRKNGTIFSEFSSKKMVLVKNAQDMFEFIEKRYPSLELAAASRLVRANFHILLQIPICSENQKYINLINNNIKKYRGRVIKDKRAKSGTKVALLISYINIRILIKLKRFKVMGKK